MHHPKKILIGAVHPWESPFVKSGSHHYANLFAKDGYQVCWVSHPVSLLDPFRKLYRARVQSALKGISSANGVMSYTPFTLLPYLRIFPFNTTFVGKHHLRFSIPSVKNVLASHGFEDVDILLIDDMSLSYLTEIVRYKKLILRIVDDLGGLPTTPKSILSLQNTLIEKADCVFITSPELMKYNALNRKKFWCIPNGVDLEHFQGSFPLPKEYREIPSPRILFVGSLFQWVDIDLIAAVAHSLPSYNFILMGPASIPLDSVKNQSNVCVLGPKPYEEVPAYMKYADVAIIPFRQNELAKSISPLKLFEYLACGLQVVSTPMKGLESMHPPISFAATHMAFAAAIEQAYRKGKNHAEFFEFAQKNSWVNRYKTMKDILHI